MSYNLVSEFLINPVLRQARRFSRSASADNANPTVARSGIVVGDATAIEDIVEAMEGLAGPDFQQDSSRGAISDAPLTASPVASPVEDDGGLEAQLASTGYTQHFDTAIPSAPNVTRRLRMASLRSRSEQVDDEVTDNPSFGIPDRFRSDSGGTMSPLAGTSRRSTMDQVGPNDSRRNISLPADDGMGALRHQIIIIQSMDISAGQKARLMHELLTKGYSRSQEVSHAKKQPVELSRAGTISQERPTTPSSLSSFIWQMNGSPESTATDHQHTFHLSPSDLKPTYAPLEQAEFDEDGDLNVEDVEPVLGCQHYKRNVKLQCATCDKWYTCRLCHDEVEDHILIRKSTKNMLCMICGCAQRASEFCVGCGERTAWYYCDVCKLWDNDSNKNIYHCNDCGICRKGRGLGKDFFHCKTCGTCMSMSVEKSHKCIERVSDCDCPICGEYMFTSPSPVVFMLCGHGIHKACYDEHMKSSYKCPICSKSTVNMETQFRNLDRAIESQPMPSQFQDTKAMVSCNDCYAKSAVKYHWLGLKCAICDSYNTAQLSILSDPAIEVPAIDSRGSGEATPQEQMNIDLLASGLNIPGAGRQRRHSSLILSSTSEDALSRVDALTRYSRLGRSVSPMRPTGYFQSSGIASSVETDGSVDEEELDFWGRDEPRGVTSAGNMDEDMEDDSDEDSTMGDGDEGDDDEDQFELLGHR